MRHDYLKNSKIASLTRNTLFGADRSDEKVKGEGTPSKGESPKKILPMV
jgi:hypothetical protein